MSASGRSKTAVVFTSGGPIGVGVQSVLEAPDIKALDLNWRIHNASVTRYTCAAVRVSLDAFNDTRHLPRQLGTCRQACAGVAELPRMPNVACTQQLYGPLN